MDASTSAWDAQLAKSPLLGPDLRPKTPPPGADRNVQHAPGNRFSRVRSQDQLAPLLLEPKPDQPKYVKRPRSALQTMLSRRPPSADRRGVVDLVDMSRLKPSELRALAR